MGSVARLDAISLLACVVAVAGCGSSPRTEDAAVRPDDGATDAAPSRDAFGVDGAMDAAAPTACVARGCLRSVRSLGSFTLSDLEPYLEEGVVLANGYSLFAIEYVTQPLDAALRTSLATVAIPYEADSPPEGFAIVANAHGTVGLDDACTLTGTVHGSGLAGLFGARGAIGVATDYPGLGTSGLHPYLVAEVEGAAVLDSLVAAANLARGEGVPISQRYAVVGLSQGGHATLAAARMHATHAPELDVRAFGAAAPATVWLEHWRGGVAVPGPHQPFHAMVSYAWADHGEHDGLPLFAARSPSVRDVLRTHCLFPIGRTSDTYLDALGTDPAAIFDAAFLEAYAAGDLSAYPVIERAFAANRIGPYEQTAPLAIWQGDADDTVLETHTTEVVAALRAGGNTVDYRIVPGGGHIDTAFGYVAQNQLRTEESIGWVLERLRE